MSLASKLRRGGLHATTYLTYWDTTDSGTRQTSRPTSAYVQYQTGVLVNGTATRTTSASGSRYTAWATSVSGTRSTSWTTSWNSWGPGSRPFGHNTTVSYQWETSRYTYIKFSEDGWDTYFNTNYNSTFFVVDGYYNTDIPMSRQTSAQVGYTTSWYTGAYVGYTTYFNTSYNSSYWSYWYTGYYSSYSTAYNTPYATTYQTSRSTTRDTTW